MAESRFKPQLASNGTIWTYFLEERKRTREQVYGLMTAMELGAFISDASPLLAALRTWLRTESEEIERHANKDPLRGTAVTAFTRSTRQHLPPALIEAFRPLRMIERVAVLLRVLQRRAGRLFAELKATPALQLFLESPGKKQMMAAFADFAAECLGIERPTLRELAALYVLGGYDPEEDFTTDKEETERRITAWTNVRRNSDEILQKLRELTGQNPTTRGAVNSSSPDPESGQLPQEAQGRDPESQISSPSLGGR